MQYKQGEFTRISLDFNHIKRMGVLNRKVLQFRNRKVSWNNTLKVGFLNVIVPYLYLVSIVIMQSPINKAFQAMSYFLYRKVTTTKQTITKRIRNLHKAL